MKTLVHIIVILFYLNSFVLGADWSFIEEYAPYVYFKSDEKYFPSSVEFFFNYTQKVKYDQYQGDVAETIESLSDPQDKLPFFEGEDISSGSVPIYAFVVPEVYEETDIQPTKTEALEVIENPLVGDLRVVYIIFYPYNYGKEVAGTVYGNHVGDLEKVYIVFKDGEPQYVNFDAHADDGERLSWDEVSRIENHPITFIAYGSHGTYNEGGVYVYDTLFGLTDECAESTSEGIFWDTSTNIEIILPTDWISKNTDWWDHNNYPYLVDLEIMGNLEENCLPDIGFGEACELVTGPRSFLGKGDLQQVLEYLSRDEIGLVCHGDKVYDDECLWPAGGWSSRVIESEEDDDDGGVNSGDGISSNSEISYDERDEEYCSETTSFVSCPPVEIYFHDIVDVENNENCRISHKYSKCIEWGECLPLSDLLLEEYDDVLISKDVTLEMFNRTDIEEYYVVLKVLLKELSSSNNYVGWGTKIQYFARLESESRSDFTCQSSNLAYEETFRNGICDQSWFDRSSELGISVYSDEMNMRSYVGCRSDGVFGSSSDLVFYFRPGFSFVTLVCTLLGTFGVWGCILGPPVAYYFYLLCVLVESKDGQDDDDDNYLEIQKKRKRIALGRDGEFKKLRRDEEELIGDLELSVEDGIFVVRKTETSNQENDENEEEEEDVIIISQSEHEDVKQQQEEEEGGIEIIDHVELDESFYIDTSSAELDESEETEEEEEEPSSSSTSSTEEDEPIKTTTTTVTVTTKEEDKKKKKKKIDVISSCFSNCCLQTSKILGLLSSVVKSILIISSSIFIRQILLLYTISFLFHVLPTEDTPAFTYFQLQGDLRIVYHILYFLFLFILFFLIISCCWVRLKWCANPFVTGLLVLVYQEWIVFRILMTVLLSLIFFSNILTIYTNHVYSVLIIKGDLQGLNTVLGKVVLPLGYIVFATLGVLSFNDVGSIRMVRKLRRLKSVGDFPKFRMPVWECMKSSTSSMVSDLLLVLSYLRYEKRDDDEKNLKELVMEMKEKPEFSHLGGIESVSKLEVSEIEFLIDFFFEEEEEEENKMEISHEEGGEEGEDEGGEEEEEKEEKIKTGEEEEEEESKQEKSLEEEKEKIKTEVEVEDGQEKDDSQENDENSPKKTKRTTRRRKREKRSKRFREIMMYEPPISRKWIKYWCLSCFCFICCGYQVEFFNMLFSKIICLKILGKKFKEKRDREIGN